MITDAFDKSEVLFGPKDFYGEKKNLCDKCIIVFSEVIFEYMLETYEHEQAGVIRCCNGVTAVYVFEIEGMKIAGYLSHIGSALAGSDVIDANWLTGADKFIMFGSAGSLDSNATDGKFVIPTAAYREDGLSYHYAAPTDYIEIKNTKAVKEIFMNGICMIFLQQEMYLIRRCMMFRDLQLRIIIWTNCILPLKLERESEEKGKVEYVKIKTIQ